MLFDGFVRRASAAGEFGTREIGKPADRPKRPPRAKVGLALGGGAAKGWSHIGVLRTLSEAGIAPDIVVGCSIGAVVGGCYAAGKLDQVEAFARSLTKRRVVGLLDVHLGGSGLIGGDRIRRLLDIDLADSRTEDLPVRFATVATELRTGHEIWLTEGPVVDAMRASYALPGVFSPVKIGGRWLVDGALVNPVPVTLARGLGADVVICVNLNGDVRLRSTVVQAHGGDGSGSLVKAVIDEPRTNWLFRPFRDGSGPRADREPDAPGISGVMTDAFNIMQDRISRSRLAGDPPDTTIVPKTAGIGLFEFHRASECIELGRRAADRALPEIREFLTAAGIDLPAQPAGSAKLAAAAQPAVM